MPTTNVELKLWVESVAQLTKPQEIRWCDGSEQEYQSLVNNMLATKQLHQLNPETYPRCYLYRSDPTDVARTEHLTFVCTKDKNTAGPNNNWLSPDAGHQKIDALFAGCMTGRTMYVVPYCMGPINSPYSRFGVEITDSPYVAINMRLMTRMGTQALDAINKGASFVKGLHSTGDLSPERRFIMHFPEEMMIKSIGSGYGGNALLGKKCHSLRLASYQAQHEGWLAEHMLIVGVENPQGETHYIAAAFPSACGKTNLAMLIPPNGYREKGWKVWTVGDDIAWIHLGEDGRMYAINPEAGYFGVAPGTSEKTNPNALAMLRHDTIFTNVGLTADNEPWWEGLGGKGPVTDWLGKPYDPARGPAAHPNSRFTVAAKQCPSYSSQAENPRGVPLSAIVFGGRRPRLVPLVCEAKNWAHGVLMGASLASETTAAATGQVGVLRHDPMAMKPFCGYHFGSYWRHWLSFAEKSSKLPKIFSVNWFRQDNSGKFLWPGFGDNIRVLEWIIARVKGQAEACATPIGFTPAAGALNLEGLSLSEDQIASLLAVDHAGWKSELAETRTYLQQFSPELPAELMQTLDANYAALSS
jgi:phosphoenolpyruvate carboxykinase (GTP)